MDMNEAIQNLNFICHKTRASTFDGGIIRTKNKSVPIAYNSYIIYKLIALDDEPGHLTFHVVNKENGDIIDTVVAPFSEFVEIGTTDLIHYDYVYDFETNEVHDE